VTHDAHATTCPDTGRLQDFLEALLPEDDMERLAEHVADCPRCLAGQARFERLFDALEALPLESPSPALAERVLDQVLPARRATRWARRIGIGYAAALVASLGTVAVLATQPSGRAFMAWITSAAPARLLDSVRFVLNVASFVALRLAGGWGLVSSTGARVSPFWRAVLAAVDTPLVQICFLVSALSCVAVLLWLRPRAARDGRGMPHVGLLGW